MSSGVITLPIKALKKSKEEKKDVDKQACRGGERTRKRHEKKQIEEEWGSASTVNGQSVRQTDRHVDT